MMPAKLENPFGERCCDGGAAPSSGSSQPCGCDPGANYISPNCNLHTIPQDQVSDLCCTYTVAVPRQEISRPTNPKEIRVVDSATGAEKGSKLARFDLVPPEALWQLAEHYGKGCAKYADRNWEKGYKWGLSVAAMQRHIYQWLQGESIDKETGSHHLIAAAWHCFALVTYELRGLGTDDVRPTR